MYAQALGGHASIVKKDI